MLHKTTVAPATLRLLWQLMDIPELSAFVLVGGTNLSLRFGHRISVDLDLFTNTPFEREEIIQKIVKSMPQTILLDQRKQSIWLTIDGVKVDIILHEYPYIKGEELIENIRFLAVEDVIPMKLEAMATRGVKKDFWDIAELLNHFTLSQMLVFYQQKYPHSDIGHIILAMTYFTDAETELNDPQDLKGITWAQVKRKIQNTVDIFLRGYLR